jgi:hypothetical protein
MGREDLPIPKKRAKTTTTTATANSKAMRTLSRAKGAVLSPKSHNSRTLPYSPLKPTNTSPAKTYPVNQAGPFATSRPASPIKPLLTVPTTTTGLSKPLSRAPSRQTKRPAATAKQSAPESEMEGRDSEASTTSAGTTIVTKPAAKKAAAARKAPAVTVKRAVAKNEVTSAPAPLLTAGGRTLRKRG